MKKCLTSYFVLFLQTNRLALEEVAQISGPVKRKAGIRTQASAHFLTI